MRFFPLEGLLPKLPPKEQIFCLSIPELFWILHGLRVKPLVFGLTLDGSLFPEFLRRRELFVFLSY